MTGFIVPVGALCVFWAITAACGLDIFAYCRGRRICLGSNFGQEYTTRERIDRNGVRWCYVYPLTRVGHVVLLADGKTAGESSYITSWTLSRERVEQRNARFIGSAG